MKSRPQAMPYDMSAGAACLYYILQGFGKTFDQQAFLEAAGLPLLAPDITDLSEAAERLDCRTRCVFTSAKQIAKDIKLPCILQWGNNEYRVLTAVRNWGIGIHYDCINPSSGTRTRYTLKEFEQVWRQQTAGKGMGEILLIDKTFRFNNEHLPPVQSLGWKQVLQYFRQSNWQSVQVIVALLITSFLQLIFPFLMQGIVDIGINTKDLNYIRIILAAECMLIISLVSADFIRSRLLLYISSITNLSILSDFWIKLTHLPLSYFDRRHTGEIMQRVEDNKQLQNFFTGPALSTLFSMLNFVVFAIVLIMYNLQLFIIFLVGVLLYFGWMLLFLKVRRKINYRIFHASSKENNATLQLVQGMQEIRLFSAAQSKRWEWESVQAEIFKLNFKNLTYGQFQRAGAILINQGKNVVLTFVVATLVMQGKLTFGAMLAIEYVIGQLSGPIEQFIGFVQVFQDAKISMDRLNEVHEMEEEENNEQAIRSLPDNKTIIFEDVTFSYPGNANEPVLKNIQLEIPEGKITAIVGVSGSGKTTLLKLLMKFYDQYQGRIMIGDRDFRELSASYWRKNCCAVLQEGFIFNDSIARNIAVTYGDPDEDRLLQACRIANLLSFIESLTDGFDTKLGVDGMGLSQGQKQRLLIARAIYRDPLFLIFDESTNALDANNEQQIVANLHEFFEGKTVLIIAHRLSTVKNADKIIVLHNGNIIEEGDHITLSRLKGKYFELVKNQLELGA